MHEMQNLANFPKLFHLQGMTCNIFSITCNTLILIKFGTMDPWMTKILNSFFKKLRTTPLYIEVEMHVDSFDLVEYFSFKHLGAFLVEEIPDFML